jgi:hypothetical protein
VVHRGKYELVSFLVGGSVMSIDGYGDGGIVDKLVCAVHVGSVIFCTDNVAILLKLLADHTTQRAFPR